jgi:hypothetical protein
MGEPWSQYVIQVVMKIGLTCSRVYGVCSRHLKKPVLAVVLVSRPVCSGDRCILYSAGVFMLWPGVCVVDGSSSQGGSVSRGQSALVLVLYGAQECTFRHRVLLPSVS